MTHVFLGSTQVGAVKENGEVGSSFPGDTMDSKSPLSDQHAITRRHAAGRDGDHTPPFAITTGAEVTPRPLRKIVTIGDKCWPIYPGFRASGYSPLTDSEFCMMQVVSAGDGIATDRANRCYGLIRASWRFVILIVRDPRWSFLRRIPNLQSGVDRELCQSYSPCPFARL